MVQSDDTLGVWDRCQLDSDSQDNLAYDNRVLGPVIGIDLGTSNSCVSLWHTVKNRAKVVKNVTSKSKITAKFVRHCDACLEVNSHRITIRTFVTSINCPQLWFL